MNQLNENFRKLFIAFGVRIISNVKNTFGVRIILLFDYVTQPSIKGKQKKHPNL